MTTTAKLLEQVAETCAKYREGLEAAVASSKIPPAAKIPVAISSVLRCFDRVSALPDDRDLAPGEARELAAALLGMAVGSVYVLDELGLDPGPVEVDAGEGPSRFERPPEAPAPPKPPSHANAVLGPYEVRRLFPEAERGAQRAAQLVGAMLPPGFGFVLFVASFGRDGDEGGLSTYVSSMDRRDTPKALRECAEIIERAGDRPPGNVGVRD